MNKLLTKRLFGIAIVPIFGSYCVLSVTVYASEMIIIKSFNSTLNKTITIQLPKSKGELFIYS